MIDRKYIYLGSVSSGEGEASSGICFPYGTPVITDQGEIPINEIDYSNWKGDLNTIQERVDGKRQIWIQDPQGYWIEINDVHSKPNL